MAAERPSPPLNPGFSDQMTTSITLTWETPISDGGSMITGYIIEKCEDGTDKWLRCNARLCPELFYQVRSSTYWFLSFYFFLAVYLYGLHVFTTAKPSIVALTCQFVFYFFFCQPDCILFIGISIAELLTINDRNIHSK